MTDALVLDVGHAGCTIVRTDKRTLVIDAGRSVVSEALDAIGVSRIDHLILTHRDRDHTSGAWTLLSDPRYSVGRLYVNPHPHGTDSRSINRAANLAWELDRTVKQDINVTTTQDLTAQDLSVEILWPNIEFSNEGVGGSVQGTALDAHRLAVVTRISAWSGRSVLLCADAEHSVLERLIATEADKLRADVLVYPHHGGRAFARQDDATERKFAESLTRAVDPEIVIFSNGRTQFDNPRREVLEGVRAAGAKVRVACTQINSRCGDPVLGVTRALPGGGNASGHSCAGSILLSLDDTSPLDPSEAAHRAVLKQLASPECQSSV